MFSTLLNNYTFNSFALTFSKWSAVDVLYVERGFKVNCSSGAVYEKRVFCVAFLNSVGSDRLVHLLSLIGNCIEVDNIVEVSCNQRRS